MADLNEFLRYTRSQEDIKMRSITKLRRMARENEKARAAKAEKRLEEEGNEPQKGKKKFDIEGTSRSDVPKSEIRRNIKSFQRSNKDKVRRYTYISEKMKRATEMEAEKRENVTVFEKFTGSKKADLKSGYDENALGTNDKFETPEPRKKGDERDE